MVSAGFAVKRLPTTSVLRHQAFLFGWILRLTHHRWRRIKISQADALRYLHVRDAAGNWHIGAAAFLVIWQQLRYWRFLAVLVGLPIIRQIAAMVYNRFADYRFARLAHCQIAQKNLAEAQGDGRYP